jgi:hypothetical protein
MLRGRNLRARLALTAASIARTEENVAATLDRLAVVRPLEAKRLHERAASARQFAAKERDRAAAYCWPPQSRADGSRAAGPDETAAY